MMDCATCQREAGVEPVARWKAPLFFVGALLFCPCHLPATFAFVAAGGAALTGAAWLFANKALIYATFSLVYLVLIFLLYRWFVRTRDNEHHVEEFHATHATQESNGPRPSP